MTKRLILIGGTQVWINDNDDAPTDNRSSIRQIVLVWLAALIVAGGGLTGFMTLGMWLLG
jgi:hypothetical protein